MADAKDELSIRISLKNLEQSKRELREFFADVTQNQKKVDEAVGGKGGRGGEAGGGKETTGGAGGQFGAHLMANLLSASFSTFKQSLAQVFDPNSSQVEKQIRVAQAGLSSIPFIGDAASAILGQISQPQLGAAQGTASRINQILGPAFQAAGALSDEEFEKRFSPQIKRLQELFAPQERSRERGSELVARLSPGLSEQDVNDMKKQAVEQAKAFLKSIESISGVTTALDNLQKNTKDLGTAFRQIVDYWSSKFAHLPGLNR